jgi:hypothetical protein
MPDMPQTSAVGVDASARMLSLGVDAPGWTEIAGTRWLPAEIASGSSALPLGPIQ